MRKLVLSLPLLLSVFGCAHESDVPVALSNKFSPQITVRGPSRYEDPILGISKEWYLRSSVDKKTGYVTHQLYISIAYLGGWKFFTTASNDQGQSLSVRQVDPGYGASCDIEICDALSVDLSGAYLRAHAATGFAVKLSDDADHSFVLNVSPEMVTEQLQVADRQSEALRPRG